MQSVDGRITFSKSKKAPKKEKESNADSAYQDRAKQEQKRRKNATDSEFWLCLCFKTDADRARFTEKIGYSGGRFVNGVEFRKLTEKIKPDAPKRGFPRKARSVVRTPDPLKDVPQTESLAVDCIAEADALLAAFKSVKRPEPCREATDSDIWICVAFDDREDAESYLAEQNIGKFGNKYIDASAWLKAL